MDHRALTQHQRSAVLALFAAAPLFGLAACGSSGDSDTDGPVDTRGDHIRWWDAPPMQPDAPPWVPDGGPSDGPREGWISCCDVVPGQPDAPPVDAITPIDFAPPFRVDSRDVLLCQPTAFYTAPGCSNTQPKTVCASPDGGSSGAMLLYCGCSGNTGTFSVVDGTRGAFEPYQFEGCCPGSIVNSPYGTYLCTRVMDGGSLDVFPLDIPVRDAPATPIDAPFGSPDGGAVSVDGAGSSG
jgi:hypothetical protein